MGTDIFVNETIALGEFRINRKPLAKNKSRISSPLAERIDMRPRGFWIDEIRSKRRNSAPIIYSRLEEARVIGRAEIRRRLQVHFATQKQPRDSHRAQHIVHIWLGVQGHWSGRLGAEILHDHFLNISVTRVQI